jgi:transcriptional regulator GlxA family with amidase domain
VHCGTVLRDVRRSDLVLVPAVDPDIAPHLALNRDVVPWLRRIFLAGADVASACTGAFLLAEAGLLDRKAATTHWAFQELFRQRYPRVRLEPQAIVVDQGRVVTAGGATSFLSLALYVVERLLGPDVARAASKMFLIDVNKSPQSAYAMFGTQKTHGDEEILLAQQIIEKEISVGPSVEDVARRIAMSKRNFVRRFKGATGNAPREYMQRVRVEAAKRALESTPSSIAAVRRQVGYDTAARGLGFSPRCAKFP